MEPIIERELVVSPFVGQMAGDLDREALQFWLTDLPALLDSENAEFISGGRNQLIRLRAEFGGQCHDLLVKAFGTSSRVKQAVGRARGSKARRTWEAAVHLTRAGIATPYPVCYLERRQGDAVYESYYISHFESDTVSFTQALSALFRDDPQCHAFLGLIQFVAEAIRAMHDAGFQHNDLGNQNLLLSRSTDGAWARASFIDLNRGRICSRLTPRQRARDMSRIYLPSDFLRVFMEMYYDGVPPRAFLDWESHYRKRYAVHTATRAWRHPVRTLRASRAGEQKGPYPSEKDMWVWDEKSAQAISLLRPRERKRYYPLAKGLIPAAATLRHAFRVHTAYRQILPTCFTQEVHMRGRVGLGVEPRVGTIDRQDALLQALGRPPVLMRLYHHQNEQDWAFRIETLKRWSAQGMAVSIAIVQDRRAVLDPAHWKDFLSRSLAACAEHAKFIEVGHAINRVKWGVWDLNEWATLMAPLPELVAQYANLRITGPAVIDFEYPYVVGAIERLPPGLRYHALSHHLYVDRRGAPENHQGRFSALEKLALGRAIARTLPNCDERFIVSEVNWPLAGTGEYSPVTSPYESPGPRFNDPNVSEDTYADYLLRYLCIALCSGMADQVYWWRLVARGFGLVDDTDPGQWRERPAYKMLHRFLALLGEATFIRRSMAAHCDDVTSYAYIFRKPDGEHVALVYCTGGKQQTWDAGRNHQLTCSTAEDAFGRELKLEGLAISGRPLYLRGLT
ncbi:MAG: hypothetical protein O3C57_06630 [Verrucomicrobia bacterium]|nr:hypothetical protein [Verrucomicrobiota bacterium]